MNLRNSKAKIPHAIPTQRVPKEASKEERALNAYK